MTFIVGNSHLARFSLNWPIRIQLFCLQGFRPSPTCGPSESCAGRSSRAARCPTDAPRTRRSWNEFNEDKSFRGRNSVRIKSTRFYFGDFLTSFWIIVSIVRKPVVLCSSKILESHFQSECSWSWLDFKKRWKLLVDHFENEMKVNQLIGYWCSYFSN